MLTMTVLCVVTLGTLTMGAPAVLAQCDVPLISQQNSGAPNVMILLDSSGSMNTPIYHSDYTRTTQWSGAFDWDDDYKISSAGSYVPDDIIGNGDNTLSAELIAGLHGESGSYEGNYLNWVYYHATPEQRAAIPTTTRQEVANSAVKAVMDMSPGMRFGLMRFNGDNGGLLLNELGDAISAIDTEVDNMVATGYTPTAEALVDILEYYQTSDSSAPIQSECQQSYVIVVTDGIPTRDQDVPSYIGDQDGDGREPGDCTSLGFPEMQGRDCSDYLDDVAYYLANNDVRGDLDGDQFISTYTIGFGFTSQLLADAAFNGKGMYMEAWDLNSLSTQLSSVLNDISVRETAGGAVAVGSTESNGGKYLYRGRYTPGTWKGNLESFELPYSDNDFPVWNAGVELSNRNPNSRVIWTSVNNQFLDFETTESATLSYFLAPDGPSSGPDESDAYGPDLDNDFDAADQALGPNYSASYVTDIIDWVRGDDLTGYRDRNGWLLGDIVYSTPMAVAAPQGFVFDESYQIYQAAWRNRRPVVYVGANDGMLHAFDARDGSELWAYIPRCVLGKLELLAAPNYCHQAYADLSPVAFDVKIGGSWRTVLIGGLRTGGDSYFALDITDPDAPSFLWETSVPTITSSFTEPVLIETNAGPVLWTGSGPDASGNAHAAVIRMDNGYIMLDEALGLPIAGTNAATAPIAYDQDHDGIADVVYQGDLGGSLYRWDISVAGNWTLGTLFSGTQPIQARPTLALDDTGQLNIYFGTGKYVESADLSDTTPQSIYCLRDDGSTTLDSSNLVKVTSDTTSSAGLPGWYRDLDHGSGERITQPALVVAGVVYFTSFAPTTGDCAVGALSYLYHVDYKNGVVVDSDDDGDLSDESASEEIGEGVASRPVADLDAGELVVQTSDTEIIVGGLLLGPQRVHVRAWRQQFMTADGESTPEGQ